MLEQSESEGNSLYIASIRLKHFLKTILYWVFYVYTGCPLSPQKGFEKIKDATQSTVKQLTKFCIKIQFKVCKDSVKLKINFKKLNWIKWESTEGLSFKDFHSLTKKSIFIWVVLKEILC